jgi:hypothetical protein
MNHASPRPVGASLAWLGVEAVVLGTQPMGHGVVAFIALQPAASDVRVVTPSRALKIAETRIVRELEVTNLDGDAVVVPTNLVMRGGLQTRAVERTVVLAPGATARIPVKCVEKGRWSAESAETGHVLSASETTSVSVRREMSMVKTMSLRSGAGFAAPQDAVWRGVQEELTRSGVRSPTSSYGAYLGSVRKRLVEAVQKQGYTLPVAANGVLLVSEGAWFAFEAYSSHEALAENADALLADLFTPPARTRALPISIGELVARVWSAKLEPIPVVEGTIGDPFLASAMGLDGEVMLVEGRVAHVTMAGEW